MLDLRLQAARRYESTGGGWGGVGCGGVGWGGVGSGALQVPAVLILLLLSVLLVLPPACSTARRQPRGVQFGGGARRLAFVAFDR